jgi:hypothetical protein
MTARIPIPLMVPVTWCRGLGCHTCHTWSGSNGTANERRAAAGGSEGGGEALRLHGPILARRHAAPS